MGLGRVEDAWTKCLLKKVCVKYLTNGKDLCILGIYGFVKGI